MENTRRKRTQILQMGFQAVLFLCVLLAFFLPLSINNNALLNPSRTLAVTLASFVGMFIVLIKMYGGMQLGKYKARSVASSVAFSVLLTDLITYFLLQVMNVNPDKNSHLALFGEDLPFLMMSAALQMIFCLVLVWSCTVLYYRINPRQRCLIITSSQELADHVTLKLRTFRQKYVINDIVHYECEDVWDSILANDTVFIAGVPSSEQALFETFCYKNHRPLLLLAELEDVILSTSEQIVIDDTPFLQIQRMDMTMWQRFVKRAFDIIVGVLVLLVLSPLMLLSALGIKLCDGGPIFFRQKRATIDGKIFRIIKFRTMAVEQEMAGVSARENDNRITPIGKFLRKWRIDELPQVLNIISGDMSFVGPRPEMLENVEKYSQEVPEFVYRQQMKAGLTGLAQIDGKYNTTPKDKIILDMFYIENFSLMMDIKLILRTLTVFLKKESTEGFKENANAASSIRMRVEPLATANAVIEPAPLVNKDVSSAS